MERQKDIQFDTIKKTAIPNLIVRDASENKKSAVLSEKRTFFVVNGGQRSVVAAKFRIAVKKTSELDKLFF